MKIVLDTHILLFAASGVISPARTELLSDPDHELFFSEISLWEITKLFELGRIQVDGSIAMFLERIFRHPRYRSVSLEPEVLKWIPDIGPRMHKDPADQIIVATALGLGAKLMTDDQLIAKSKLVGIL